MPSPNQIPGAVEAAARAGRERMRGDSLPWDQLPEFARVEIRTGVAEDLAAALPALEKHLFSQWREGLLSDEAKRIAAARWDEGHAAKLTQYLRSARPGEVAQPMENSDIAGAALEAALDHLEQGTDQEGER